MKFALFSGGGPRYKEPFEKFAANCAEMGFDGIEASALRPHLSPLTYRTKNSRKKLKEYLQSINIEIPDLDQRSTFKVPAQNTREHEIIVFDVLCQMAVDLDIPIIKVDHAGLTQSADPNIPWSEQRSWLIECYKDCAKVAEEYGVKCALHNHVVTTAQDSLDMIKEVGSKNMGIIIDADNSMVLHEDGAEIVRKACKDLLLMAHIKDHKRIIEYVPTNVVSGNSIYGGHYQVEVRRMCRAGEGIVDNVGFMKALKSIGYDGWLGLESFGDNVVPDLNWMKKAWNSL